jgi:hypothetical protein
MSHPTRETQPKDFKIWRKTKKKTKVRTNCNKNTHEFIATGEDANSQRDIITQELKNETMNSSLKSQIRELQNTHIAPSKHTHLAHGTCADHERGEAWALVSRTLAGGVEVGALGAHSDAGSVEHEELGGVDAGEDAPRLGGDAVEARGHHLWRRGRRMLLTPPIFSSVGLGAWGRRA